tara:strand:+ start:488 stop:1288 length:801 start_codon:yes stop_codon:yes gene_type:complete
MINSKRPLVSIIMNCHNGSQFINRSVKSIRKQKYKNWELVFWDNNSKDKSKQVIKKIKDKRIKYFFSKKFHNLYYSRNQAIKKAKGDYICFLDVDDQWKPNKLNKQVNIVKNNNYDVIFSNYFVNYELKKKYKKRIEKNVIINKDITQQLLNDYFLGIITVMIKKKIFKKFRFINRYNIIGDFDFFLRLSLITNFYFIKEPLAIYNIHKSNYSLKNLNVYIKELSLWISQNNKNLFRGYNLNNLRYLLIKLKIKNLINHVKYFMGM